MLVIRWDRDETADPDDMFEVWAHTADIDVADPDNVTSVARKVGLTSATVMEDWGVTVGVPYFHFVRGRDASGVYSAFFKTGPTTPTMIPPEYGGTGGNEPLGGLAFEDVIDLDSEETLGILSVSKGGTGEDTLAGLQALLREPWAEQFSGEFRLTSDRIVGWGVQGPSDPLQTYSLGASSATNLNALAGGFVFPFDVKVLGLRAKNTVSNAAAGEWGFVVARVAVTDESLTRSTNFILNEPADNGGVGPRNYGDLNVRNTAIDLSSAANNIVPAGETLLVAVSHPGVAAGAYNVRIMAAALELVRV